ncbi:MAG: MFS transporter [Dehalococcoidia bacterium]
MLSRPFIALYIAVFVATMGISMVSPLLPVYAEELGAEGMLLGLTFSSFAVVQAVAGPITGRMSDRYPRKPFIVCGLLVYMIAALGYLAAENVWQVIGFRAFSGLGTSMIFSVARAYVGDLTPVGHEGRWMGVFATADIIGFGTGPLIAGVIRQGIGFDAVFVAMAAMMATSAVIVATSLPRHPPKAHRRVGDVVANASFLSALSDKLVLAVVINMSLVSLSFGASFAFLGLRLEDDIGATPMMIGVAFATQDLTGGVAQPLFGRLADRYYRPMLVAIGLALLAVLQAGIGQVESYLLVVLFLAGMGAANAISGVAAGAIQVVAGRRVGMGTVLGLGSFGNGVGIITGSLVGGWLTDLYGIPAAFVFSGVIIGIGAPVFLYLTRGVRTSEDEVVVRPLAEAASVAGA